MGTRADFYVGRGMSAEWLGSRAMDGYPSGPMIKEVCASSSEAEFRSNVAKLLADKTRDDCTTPDQGWPWPWNDSNTTDYAYAFADGKVWIHGMSTGWFDARHEQPPNLFRVESEFPDMSTRRNTAVGPRSGLIVLSDMPPVAGVRK